MEDVDSVLVVGGKLGYGVEGVFYVWMKSEIDVVCGLMLLLVCVYFGVIGSGNVFV